MMAMANTTGFWLISNGFVTGPENSPECDLAFWDVGSYDFPMILYGFV